MQLEPRVDRATMVALAMLVALSNAACSSYRVVKTIRNGGDAPPFVDVQAVKKGATPTLEVGDSIAVIHSDFETVLIANAIDIDLTARAPSEPSKQQRKAAEPSKAQRKAQQPSKADRKAQEPSKADRKQHEPTKEQRKAAEPSKDQRKAAEPSKGERKSQEPGKAERKAQEPSKAERKAAEPSKADRKQDRPILTAFKRVRLPDESGNREGPEYYKREIRSDESPGKVILRLGVWNGGNARFHGTIDLLDRLSPDLRFVRTLGARTVRQNAWKKFFLHIPLLNWYIAPLIPEYSTREVAAADIGMTETLEGDLLEYHLKDAKIDDDRGLVVDFEVALPESWTAAAP